jgi:hypothetical protein
VIPSRPDIMPMPLRAHSLCVAALLCAAHAGASLADPAAEPAASGTAASTPKTLKERLGDKASDEQRVNDCKVPPERRGPKPRPSACTP